MIFVPSYFDFLRVENYLKSIEDLDFACISEWVTLSLLFRTVLMTLSQVFYQFRGSESQECFLEREASVFGDHRALSILQTVSRFFVSPTQMADPG